MRVIISLFFLPFTVANKAFPKDQTVLDYLINDLRVQENDLRQPQLQQRITNMLAKYIKGLKISYEIRGERRTYKVNGLGNNAFDYT